MDENFEMDRVEFARVDLDKVICIITVRLKNSKMKKNDDVFFLLVYEEPF